MAAICFALSLPSLKFLPRMKFERNTVIGFIVLAALFIGYFYYNSVEQAAYQKSQARAQAINDSIENAQKPRQDPAVALADSLHRDSLNKLAGAGDFNGAGIGAERIDTVSNSVFTVAF